MLGAIALLAMIGVSIALPSASAFGSPHFMKRDPLQPRQGTQKQYDTEYYFDQLIDHGNPSAGTFKQRFFFSDEYYKGQGSPIVIGTPGEQSADGFYADLTGYSIMNKMMDTWGAAGVVLEHRYWGKSSPYSTLTAPNLQFLTVEQAITDYKYFLDNVQLPWASGNYTSNPSSTPWVNVGCSYPGLLVAYTQEQYPDLFAAGYATSAPVNADGDFWEYWEPIEEGMPQNCSSDLAAAVAYMDNIMSTGTQEDALALKTKFGMQEVANDDFAYALQWPINTWQELQAYSFAKDGTSTFQQFCDVIETNADGTQNTNAQGVGMPQALENWARVFKAWGPDQNCPGGFCYDTTDPTQDKFMDTSVSDTYGRAWMWMVCTEFGWFQVGDPGNSSSIVSSQVTTAYAQRQCSNYFPLADGTHSTYDFSQDTTALNSQFKGWNVVGNNLFVVNGEFDPWRSASLSSKWAPYFTDTPTQTIVVIPNAHHCWDYSLMNGDVDPNVKATVDQGITEIGGWLQNWYKSHPEVSNNLSNAATTAETADPIAEAADPIGETVNNVNGTNGTSGTDDSDVSDLQRKVDELTANKKLAIISYALNAVLALAVIICLVWLILAKRSASKSSRSGPSIPKWSLGKGGVQHGDQLGEYGSGSMAGGRGQYQQLKEQTV
ncbi:hypothetical protein FRC04_007089 [Tulasnella sp. 424]|nr:hypothetical protein FRC04_007089 [Tulasnella sp. 424]KAG8976888.1 hypothetical protein FRC05_002825 [Tulasnella sp. 425]